MSQALTVTPKTIEQILTRLETLTKEVKMIKTRLFEEEPTYGSDAWWEKEEAEADKEIKEGKYTVYENAQDLIADLHAGK